MALRLDKYYEEYKNLTIDEINNRIKQNKKWLRSTERKEYEKNEKAKPLSQRLIDGPVWDKQASLSVLRKLKREKYFQKFLDIFKINKQ